VLLDGKPIKLALPAGTRAGDWVELRQGTLPTAVVPAAGTPSRDTGLSQLGRLIASLLAGEPHAATPPRAPLLDAPPAGSAKLLPALARAIEDSGLFYESHQARWLAGDYPLARLREEPQDRLAHGAAVQAAPSRHDLGSAEAVGAPGLPAGESENAPPSAAPIVETADEQPPQPLAPGHGALVRAQLEALASRHIAWTGELWPGQQAHWELAADERDGASEETPFEWRSSLTLTMPRLGAIDAALSFGARGVRIRLTVEEPQRLPLLRTALPQLAQALAEAGLHDVQLEAGSRAPRP
jgi:hypothetical protein